jgi:hypothetical protein
MALNFNPFFLDVTTNFGVMIFVVLICLSVFLFFKRFFKVSGALLLFLGFLVLFNNINYLIAVLFFVFGVIVIFMDGS